MKPKNILFVFLFFISTIQVVPSYSQDTSDKNNLIQKAENGDKTSMYILASNYNIGMGGFPKDQKKALKWYKKGAELGDRLCMASLARLLAENPQSKRDLLDAISWYEKAIKLGSTLSMHNLGELYLLNKIPKVWGHRSAKRSHRNKDNVFLFSIKDNTKAAQWFRSSAEKGNKESQTLLGLMNIYGMGVPKNKEQGFKWLQMAANENSPSANYYLGLMYFDSQAVAQDIQKGIDYLTKAASENHTQAIQFLSQIYREGIGVKKDITIAKKWDDKFQTAKTYRRSQKTLADRETLIIKQYHNLKSSNTIQSNWLDVLGLVTELFKEPKKNNEIRHVPYYQNGQSQGIKFLSLSDNSYSKKFGIKRGDVLSVLDQTVLKTNTNPEKILTKLRQQNHFSLGLNRKGDLIKYDVLIRD